MRREKHDHYLEVLSLSEAIKVVQLVVAVFDNAEHYEFKLAVAEAKPWESKRALSLPVG